jgi:superfamily I DNA/RNA helicase
VSIDAVLVTAALGVPHPASASQREAIEAEPRPLLVLAGPGAGKTFCLIERIRFLVEERGFDPARICAFTFTNKAAGEIAGRLERHLGPRAEGIKRGTIHAFCAELLREFGAHVGLEPGFGIADEEYQVSVLRRLEGPRPWHRRLLSRFSAHRFREEPLRPNDTDLFLAYERFLTDRKLLDFDMLVIKAADLMEHEVAPPIRQRWDVVLVDEFQDLNPVQYRVIKALAHDHRHVFAVGDDEQSIFSWAGADPKVFKSFLNDFGITDASGQVHLQENRRCPRDVFALARCLISKNTPLFSNRVVPLANREPTFPVAALDFDTDDAELAWLVDDIRVDRATHGHEWGDVALLYRKHEIGDALEAAFVNGGVPCRLAQGRALAEDPVVAYVLAALRVVARPHDDIHRDDFFGIVLPRALFDEARAQAEASKRSLSWQLYHMAAQRPRADEGARQIKRAIYVCRNLEAIGRRHNSVAALVQELLSQRVGRFRSVLEDRHDELTDPAAHPDVVDLAERLRTARAQNQEICIERCGGAEIALKAILEAIGCTRVRLGDATEAGAEHIGQDETPSLGAALGLFKAAQLLETSEFNTPFRDFTAVDLETTDNDIKRAEIVQIAAVRVRDGFPVDEFTTLVRPRVPIAPGAARVHGIREADVASAPYFEEVWPMFRAFCGGDVVVAHNGYEFDFPILKRMVKGLREKFELCPYDSLPLARDLFPTSRKLVDLARKFGIDSGQSHQAIDDTRTLARVFVQLDDAKLVRARKTSLVNLLDQLGVALALSDEGTLGPEAELLRHITRGFALGRYSTSLDHYAQERADDESLPSLDQLIDRLGGAKLMERIRSEKTADERYPEAMLRMRRLITELPDGPLGDQLSVFLERAVLSKWDGAEPDRARVNLLTLHSTKGLEFSRVYVVGTEDAQLPGGGSATTAPNDEEVEEARRLLYVGMTRAKDRLVLTRVASRRGKVTGGYQFLDEMGLVPRPPVNEPSLTRVG